MKIKTNQLTGAALDWAVAKCEGIELTNGCYNRLLVDGRMSRGQEMLAPYNPSTDWARGGPIIQREELSSLKCYSTNEWGCLNGEVFCEGPTPLIAAMRCYVASRFGDEVDVPDELVK